MLIGKFEWLRHQSLFLGFRNTNGGTALLYVVPLLVFALVFYGANSVRGTDQYWYLADVEAAIDGAPPVTNAYFPGPLIRGDVGADNPNYIYHNGPMLSASAILGKHTGAYRAWILINLVCHFVVALAIFLVSKARTTTSIATVVSVLYLISPLALWQTMSMLLEQYLAGVMAMVVIGYVYRQHAVGKCLFAAGIVLGALSHPMFVAIGCMAGLAVAALGVSRRRFIEIATGFAIVACAMYAGHSASDLFPTGFFPRLSIAVANVVPNQENMYWYFTDQGHSISPQLIMAKVIEAAYRQFISLPRLPFNLFTNLALLVWIWLALRKRHQYPGFLIASGFVLALYLALIVLMQHQFRYQQIIAPVVFVLIAIGVHHLPVLRKRALVAGILVCMLVSGVYLSNMSRQKANRQSVAAMAQQKDTDFISAHARIVAYDCECDQRMNYVLKPRPILNIKSRYLEPSAQKQAISLFEPDYMVSNQDTLQNKFDFLTPVKSVDDSLYGTLHWYKVDARQKVEVTHQVRVLN